MTARGSLFRHAWVLNWHSTIWENKSKFGNIDSNNYWIPHKEKRSKNFSKFKSWYSKWLGMLTLISKWKKLGKTQKELRAPLKVRNGSKACERLETWTDYRRDNISERSLVKKNWQRKIFLGYFWPFLGQNLLACSWSLRVCYFFPPCGYSWDIFSIFLKAKSSFFQYIFGIFSKYYYNNSWDNSWVFLTYFQDILLQCFQIFATYFFTLSGIFDSLLFNAFLSSFCCVYFIIFLVYPSNIYLTNYLWIFISFCDQFFVSIFQFFFLIKCIFRQHHWISIFCQKIVKNHKQCEKD